MILRPFRFGVDSLGSEDSSCWIGAYNESDVREQLGVPENLRVVSLLTIRYPDEEPSPKRRIVLHNIIHYEGYGKRSA